MARAGVPGESTPGQGKAGRGGPQSHLFLLTLAHALGGADGLFMRVHETQGQTGVLPPACGSWHRAVGATDRD